MSRSPRSIASQSVLAAAVAVLALGAGVSEGAVADRGGTALRIVYYEDGREPETRVVRALACDPVRGDHPRRKAACRELARLGSATLRPVPRGSACAAVDGGPQVAFVTGTIGGRSVWVRLRRDDRCQLKRWNRNWFLVAGDRVR